MVDNKDKAVAILGIAATKNPKDQPCPPDNVMSAFIENRVNSETRIMMLSHLNQCEDCYLVWEQLGVYAAMEENVQAVKQQEVDKIGLIQRFKNWYNDKPIWQTAVPGFALASLAVILVVNQSDVPHQNISPDSSITMASADNDGLIESIKQYPSPWENQTLGFSSSTYSTPVKAVGIGIWRSKSKLINSKDPLPVQLESEVAIDWKTSEWRDYYAFGEWIINAWELANEEQVGLSKWVELSKTLQTLESNFKQHPKPEPEAEITLQAIDKIKVSLGLLSQKKDTLAQTTLLREMDLGLQKLFF